MTIKTDIKSFTRQLAIKERFNNVTFEDESLVRNKSTKLFQPISNELKAIVEGIENLDPIRIEKPDNLTKDERNALSELKENQNIVFKKADKGGSFVIMDNEFYRDKLVINDHLSTPTYKKVNKDCDVNVFKNLQKHVKKFEHCLTNYEKDYLLKFELSTSNFYVLPKIHKSQMIEKAINSYNNYHIEMNTPHDLKGRPIIAGCSSPTHRLSSLLDKILMPISSKVKTYIKDDWDFIRNLPSNLTFAETTMYSVDISSLYTSISHSLGINAIKFWINKHRKLIPNRFSEEFIIESLIFVLENNYFIFDGQYYKQEDGTAMGTNVAPVYACLTVAYLEEYELFPNILPRYFNVDQCSWIQENYKRYMDDGFLPLLKSINLELFMECLNSLHPMINFTYETAKFTKNNTNVVQTLNFLDVTVILDDNNSISTDVFYKATNAHEYLNYHSDHPIHTKNNVPFNLAKRIICFVSSPQQTEYRLKELKSYLIKRNYPINVINKAFFNARLQGPAPSKEKENIIPFVTTNYSNFNCNNIIRDSKLLV